MGTKNINTHGTKTANWQAGEQLDAGFANINDLFQYLDLGYGVDNNTINEETLDNLYKSVTGNNSNINFSTTYGGGNNKVDSADDLKNFLTYLEGLDTKNVFNTITTQVEKGLVVIKPVPTTVINQYRLDNSTGFYDKMVTAHGIPIFASDNTTDQQILDTAKTLNNAFLNAPKLRDAFIANNHKVILAAPGKGELGNIPGLSQDKGFYSAFGRDAVGFHATAPSTTGINGLLLHELIGHGSAAYLRGLIPSALSSADPGFFENLEALFQQEKSKFGGNHPSNTSDPNDDPNNTTEKYWYAGANKREFWAEVVSMYFGGTPIQSGTQLSGPEELKKLSPATYAFIEQYFGQNNKITK